MPCPWHRAEPPSPRERRLGRASLPPAGLNPPTLRRRLHAEIEIRDDGCGGAQAAVPSREGIACVLEASSKRIRVDVAGPVTAVPAGSVCAPGARFTSAKQAIRW